MALEKGAKSDTRQRRAFQKLANNPLGTLGLVAGNGIEFNGTTIQANVDENFGLSVASSGIRIDLAANPGLEFSSGDLRVKVLAGTGLVRDADGLSLFPVIESGTFSPLLVAVTNLDGDPTEVDPFMFSRMGSIIQVAGVIHIDPTIPATTSFVIKDLPFVGSNFSDDGQAAGHCNSYKISTVESGAIVASAGDVSVAVSFVATEIAEHEMSITFTYILQ